MVKLRRNIIIKKVFVNETTNFSQYIDSQIQADEVIIRNVSLQSATDAAGNIRFISTDMINEPYLCNVQTNYAMGDQYYFSLNRPINTTFNFTLTNENGLLLTNYSGALIIHFEFIQHKKLIK